MQQLNGADWKRLLPEVMAETDKTQLKQKADALEEAIFNRCQTLACGDAEDSERAAMKAATAVLLKVRVEKLGFPLDLKLLQNI